MPNATSTTSPAKARRRSIAPRGERRNVAPRRATSPRREVESTPRSIAEIVPVRTAPESEVTDWRESFEILVRAQVLALLEYHEVDTKTVEVLVDGGRVILVGHVPDRLTRELVEDLAWWVPTVKHCDNFLRIAA